MNLLNAGIITVFLDKYVNYIYILFFNNTSLTLVFFPINFENICFINNF